MLLQKVSQKEYVLFMTYTLEYRILVLEQLAHEREKKILEEAAIGKGLDGGAYGTILACTFIRDFSGVGLNHIGNSGKTVLRWILGIAADNYPETLFRSHMINTPWIFNSIWYGRDCTSIYLPFQSLKIVTTSTGILSKGCLTRIQRRRSQSRGQIT